MRPLPARPPWKWLGNADNLGPARLGAQKDAKPATKPKVHKPAEASFEGSPGFSGFLEALQGPAGASENVLESVLKASWAACGGVPGASRGVPGRPASGFSGRRSGGPLASRLQEVAWKMLKFGIRQAGGCGRRPKNAKPTTKPNVQTQKKAPRPPEAPRRRPEAPGGARRHPGGARRGPREASRGLKGAPKPASTRGPRKPPRGPGGPRTVSELRRPRQEKPTTFPEDPEKVSKRSRQDLGSKPGR